MIVGLSWRLVEEPLSAVDVKVNVGLPAADA